MARMTPKHGGKKLNKPWRRKCSAGRANPLEVTWAELLSTTQARLSSKLRFGVVALPGARDGAPSPTGFGARRPQRPVGPAPVDGWAVGGALGALLGLVPNTCGK